MSNLSNQKLLSGQTNTIGPSVTHQNIDALKPADFEGSLAYSSDGVMYFSDGLSWSVSEVPPIRKPFALEALNSNHHRQLRLSPFLASGGYTATQSAVRFIASLNSDLSNPFLNLRITSPTQSSYDIDLSIPGGPTHGLTFYWRAKYIATDGQESSFSSRQILVYPYLVDKPTSLVPLTVEAGELSITPFFSTFGRTFAQTQWEIYSNALGTGVPVAITNGTSTLSALQQSPIGLPYSWRARYRDTVGTFSEWSVLQYNIQPKVIDDPVPITGEGDEAFILAISPYRSQIGRPYSKTTWQLFSTSDVSGTPLLVIENGNTALDTKGRQNILLVGTRYYWRARYQDLFGSVSEWTPLQSYVLPKLIDNTISTVRANVEIRMLTVGSYFSAYGVVYSQTQWEIFTNPAGTGTPLYSVSNSSLSLDTLSVPGAASGFGYHWRARFVGTGGQTSEYSTIQGYIQPLSLSRPVLVTAANAVAATLTVQGYASLRNSSFANTLWEVYNNPAGTGIPLATRVTDSFNLSTEGLLAANLVGHWRARFRDDLSDLSAWSVLRAYVQPIAVAPPIPVTEVNVSATLLVVSGYFSPYGKVLTQTQWEVYGNPAGTGAPIATRTSTGLTLSTLELAPDRQLYYWRARFVDSSGNLSEWSTLRGYTQELPIQPVTPITSVGAITDILTASSFSSFYGLLFGESQWEMYTTATPIGLPFASKIVTTGGSTLDTATVAELVGRGGFSYNWRVRYKSTTGLYSPWTTPLRSFTKTGGVDAPTPITADNAEATTLAISAYNSPPGLAYQDTAWEIYSNEFGTGTPLAAVTNALSTLNMNTISALVPGTYYWKARYRSATNQFSAFTVLRTVFIPDVFMRLSYTTMAADQSVSIYLGGAVNVEVNWGDGSANQTITTKGEYKRTYASIGTYAVSILGTMDSFGSYEIQTTDFVGVPPGHDQFDIPVTNGVYTLKYYAGSDGSVVGNNYNLRACTSFGQTGVKNLSHAFRGASNLTVAPATLPLIVTNTSFMFFACSSFNQPIGTWNTGNVTNMTNMFRIAANFNQPLSTWNTGNVTNMERMFTGANVFNQPIGGWNTSKVTNMFGMFQQATAFNQNIGSWDTGLVTTMNQMFSYATAFNIPIDAWNVSNVTNMSGMFYGATSFNQPLAAWNTVKVTDMQYMFFQVTSFNQPIGSWNTANVTNMSGMFAVATAFNQPIGTWNTAKVTNMASVFLFATAFNQPIDTWNMSLVTNMNQMLYGAAAFNQPIGVWDVSKVTNMQSMLGATAFNQPIGTWNVSNVTNMHQMFAEATAFNQPIGAWNVSSVTNMDFMFGYATAFNQPLEAWNVSSVTNMSRMFRNATAFNQPIGAWNVSNVTTMQMMFRDAIAFNMPVGAWNVGLVQSMSYMFQQAAAFNQPIDAWNVSNVTNMSLMFYGATAFNQPIGAWSTVKVEAMGGMFYGATLFNQPIGAWSVSNVIDMSLMFYGATAFNQPIDTWNTVKVIFMNNMFQGATFFNQSLGSWNVTNVIAMTDMLNGTALTPANYDATLVGWSGRVLKPNISFGATGVKYTATGLTARNTLTASPNNWTITDGGLAP